MFKRLCPLIAVVAVTVAAPAALASPEIDKKYELQTIGFLRSWDNVDGLFADYVAQAYREYFAKQSRFVLQDLSKADAILAHSRLPYNKVIDDNQVLGQLARATRTESLIRTKISKEGPQYRFSLDWLHSPQMDVLAHDEFVLQEPGDGRSFGLGDIKGKLLESLDRLFKQVPFIASVTGRDNNQVTVNIGSGAGVKPGDTMLVSTLDEVKKHPLLHTIVDWRLTPTGRLEVENVDEALSFCRLTEEQPGRQVARYQKITQLIPKPEPSAPPIVNESSEENKAKDEPPRLGYVMGSAWIGGFSRQYSNPASNVGKTGGGLLLGVKGDGQLWLNKQFFVDLGLRFAFFPYSQQDIQTGQDTAASGASGTLVGLKADLGYSYLITGDFFGPKGWVKLGYHSNRYDLPTSPIAGGEATGPLSFKSFFVGLGGDLPIRDGWGAVMDLEFGLLTGSTESGISSGQVGSSNDVAFSLGAYYRWTNKITFRAGFDVIANGADYVGGATVSHRIIAFTPSVVYYF